MRSQLCNQCEELSIQVTNRQCIIILRSLAVKCANDQYKKNSTLTNHNDELIEWLKERLSYIIVKNPDDVNSILIWM